ncbi:hypothetical protein [Streptomyces inhibens]|uniref:hypothetical protein n=1 Tax=Streptomyces inhibens TaxID=2293571 RepID=UPI001EE73BA0|nr:hypothetical protein [Streptomyces inhibens]UKY54646.1 hypothetical protein KI385_41500 [Streptomyces inhibens]
MKNFAPAPGEGAPPADALQSFQIALKGDEDGQDDLVIGDDFTVDPGSDDQRRKLLSAGVLFLNCTPSFHAPGGKTVEDGEVERCATIDYSEDLDFTPAPAPAPVPSPAVGTAVPIDVATMGKR